MNRHTTFLREVCRRQQAALLQWNLTTVVDVDVNAEPISIELARAHCKVDLSGSPPESDDDDRLTDVGIPGAREYCESELGLALAARTVELSSNAFPLHSTGAAGPYVELPFGPVQSIDSVKYLDDAAADAAYDAAYDASFLIDGDVSNATAAGEAAAAAALEQTLDPTTYVLDASSTPARLILAYGATWPAARNAVGSVKVRYVTGYSAPGESPQVYVLPRLALAAMLMMLGHMYKNRESVNAATQMVEVPLTTTAMLERVPGREPMGFA